MLVSFYGMETQTYKSALPGLPSIARVVKRSKKESKLIALTNKLRSMRMMNTGEVKQN